jgi:hypothetical protein
MHPTRNTLPERVRAQSIELLNSHLAAAIDLRAYAPMPVAQANHQGIINRKRELKAG